MKKMHFDVLFDTIMEEVKYTRDEGQKEYARTDDNIFANFERVADCLKIEREKVLMVYLLKHIDGISSYIDGHKSQRENVTGRVKDAIVYLLLLWAMVIGDDAFSKIKEAE
tara:strand:- start:1506 stop:1838 length:333 start_codon:yes stop_codon:yes gene_type:complete